MKTTEITKDLIGKRVKGVSTGKEVTGTVIDIIDNRYSAGVEIDLDEPVQWGRDTFYTYQSFSRKMDEFGNLKYTELI